MIGRVGAPVFNIYGEAGIVSDRYEHRKILAGCQGLTTALSLLLALGILQGLVNVWLLIAWAITVGCLAAVSTPALSAILPRLIEPHAMPSAVALVSSIWNTMPAQLKHIGIQQP